jgi:hypothetical protein
MPTKKRCASPHPEQRPAKIQAKGRGISKPYAKPAAASPPRNLRIKRLDKKARLPTRGSVHAAGYDLYRYLIPFNPHERDLTRLAAPRRKWSRQAEWRLLEQESHSPSQLERTEESHLAVD